MGKKSPTVQAAPEPPPPPEQSFDFDEYRSKQSAMWSQIMSGQQAQSARLDAALASVRASNAAAQSSRAAEAAELERKRQQRLRLNKLGHNKAIHTGGQGVLAKPITVQPRLEGD